jgi:pSer/pThr/pTyr-binding forkhead associated (FHA) protein
MVVAMEEQRPMAELIVRSEGEERVFQMEGEESVVMGRQASCAIQIDDIHSSRRHAQVIRVKSGYEVVDLKSRNGTLLNGAKVERKLLRNGDVIKIGEVEIRYVDPDAEPADEGIVLEEVGAAGGTLAEGVCTARFHGGDRNGEVVALSGDRTTIGRKASNTIVLKDAMVSSYHCEIAREGGGYILRDMGSTNGTMLNGEPITEAVLNHGASMRFGGTRLYFIDPSMEAFDASLDDDDDAGDWGMMREIDTAAVPKRRMSLAFPIGLIVVFAAMAGAFWYVTDQQKKPGTTIASPEGNLLPFYSFEEKQVAMEVPTGAKAITSSPAHAGNLGLRVSRGERTGVVAVRFPGCPVDADKRYRLEGFVKTTGDAKASLRIAWRLRKGVRTSWFATAAPVSAKGAYTAISVEATPPEDATEAVVALLLDGEQATFDDVTLTPIGEGAAARSFESGGFAFHTDDHGTFGVSREGDWVLTNCSVIVVLEDGTILDSRNGLASVAPATMNGESLTWSGAFAHPGADDIPFEISLKPAESQVTVSVKSSATYAGVAFSTDRGLLSEPVYLLGQEVREARTGAFERTNGLARVTFGGGASRLGASAAEGQNHLAAALTAGGGELRLALDVPMGEKGVGMFTLRTSFRAAVSKAADLAARARRLSRMGSLAEAYRLCQEIIVGYSFREAVVAEAHIVLKTIEKKGSAEDVAALTAFAAGRDFLDDGSLMEARSLAQAIASGWAELDRGKAASALVEQIDKIREERRLESANAAVSGEMDRARDLSARGKNHLAGAVLRSIVNSYRGTEAAEEASKLLAALVMKDSGGGAGTDENDG